MAKNIDISTIIKAFLQHERAFQYQPQAVHSSFQLRRGNGCVRWETKLSKWLYCLVFNNWSIHQWKSAARVCLVLFAVQMKWKDEIIIKREMKLTETMPELTLSDRKRQTVSVVYRQAQGILTMYEMNSYKFWANGTASRVKSIQLRVQLFPRVSSQAIRCNDDL